MKLELNKQDNEVLRRFCVANKIQLPIWRPTTKKNPTCAYQALTHFSQVRGFYQPIDRQGSNKAKTRFGSWLLWEKLMTIQSLNPLQPKSTQTWLSPTKKTIFTIPDSVIVALPLGIYKCGVSLWHLNDCNMHTSTISASFVATMISWSMNKQYFFYGKYDCDSTSLGGFQFKQL